MKPFITFNDHYILKKAMSDHGTPEAQVKEATQSGATLTMPAPVLDTRPSPPPAVPANEPAIPTASPSTTDHEKRPASCEYPNWTKIHPSYPVASMGHVPSS